MFVGFFFLSIRSLHLPLSPFGNPTIHCNNGQILEFHSDTCELYTISTYRHKSIHTCMDCNGNHEKCSTIISFYSSSFFSRLVSVLFHASIFHYTYRSVSLTHKIITIIQQNSLFMVNFSLCYVRLINAIW